MWRKRQLRKKNLSRRQFVKIVPFATIPLGLILIIIFVIRAGFLNIKQVEIENSQLRCADSSQIKDFLHLSGQNFFTLHQEVLTKKLKDKFICIKGVNLSKTFPDKVKIAVTGRQPVVILATLKEKLASSTATPSAQDISDLSLIDDEGIIFSKNTENLDLPKVFVLKNPEVGFLQILNKIKTLGISVKDSFINDNSFIINSADEGPKMVFKLNDEIDIQLASLQLILDKAKIDSGKLEFIDLRFDKPIVRFAPKKQ